MTAKKANSVGLGPFPDGIFRVDYPNLYRKPAYYTDEEAVVYYIERIKRAFDELTPASQVAAIVFEPVQGEGGFIPAPIEWVKAVRQICDENGIMMMTDEVKTGFGRTGKLFASSYYEDAGCAPDILCTAKSIAGGFPLSAIVARDEIVKGIGGGLIGGTFGGNSVSCAAALATIQVIEDENLCERSLELGVAYTARVEEWQQQYKEIADVRGLGGMIGVEFIKDRLNPCELHVDCDERLQWIQSFRGAGGLVQPCLGLRNHRPERYRSCPYAFGHPACHHEGTQKGKMG